MTGSTAQVSLWKQGFRQGLTNESIQAAFEETKTGRVNAPPPKIETAGESFASTKVPVRIKSDASMHPPAAAFAPAPPPAFASPAPPAAAFAPAPPPPVASPALSSAFPPAPPPAFAPAPPPAFATAPPPFQPTPAPPAPAAMLPPPAAPAPAPRLDLGRLAPAPAPPRDPFELQRARDRRAAIAPSLPRRSRRRHGDWSRRRRGSGVDMP